MINEKIKKVRKALSLSQEEFGKRLGVTKTAICAIENGRRNLTSQMETSIYREFNVNPEWLHHSQGEMFIETDASIIDKMVSTYHLDPMAKKMLELFVSLTEPQQKAITGYMTALVTTASQQENVKSSSITSLDNDIENEVARYRTELEAEKKGKTLSVLEEQEPKHA